MSQRAGYCSGCQTVFEYEERDVFSGSVFCPQCMSRLEADDSYPTLARAKQRHPKARVVQLGSSAGSV
jgi:hypothetical protein